MSKTYTAATHMREARPRSKRLRALGSMPGAGVTAAVPTDVLRRSDADALYHPLRGRADLPLTLKDLTFAPAAEASLSAMLEVLTIDGVQYLHTRLPFVSDQSISAGGVGQGGQGGGGITAISVNGGNPVGPAAGSSVVVLNDIASAAGLAALSSSVASLSSTVAGKIDNPSGGAAGYYLRKTVSGVEWASVSGGGDDTATYLGEKLGIQVATNPGQSNGKFLMGAGVDSMGNLLATWTKVDVFSGDYNDLINKPTLFSGNYNDLVNTPNLGIYLRKSDFGDYLIQRIGIDGCEVPVSSTGVLKRTTGYKAQWVDLDDYYHPLGGSDSIAFVAKGLKIYNDNGDFVELVIDHNGYLCIDGSAYATGFLSAGGVNE